ncbi:MAG: glycosyltransferase family 39 protein [Planctomycetota bacterium]|jgi:4-amino-4-deoxy-L-arabinose transferase-like glycosyltransferase
MKDVFQGSGRTAVLILVALWLVIYFPNLWVREFTGTDEPQYAQIGREVLLDGHWFALRLNDNPYYGEAPLYFWLEAVLSLPYGDVTEFSATMPSMLMALGTILLVYFLGRRLFNRRAGLLAALIMVSMPQFHKYGCMARLDVPSAFLVTASLTAFYFGYTEPNYRRRYLLMAWILTGLAAITSKGPVTFLMVGGTVTAFLWRRNDLKFLRDTQPIGGGILLAAVILVWLIPAYLSDGRGYFEGLLGQVTHHAKTPLGVDKFFFYFSNIFSGTLPWSLALPGVVYLYLKKTVEGRKGIEFAGLWLLVMLLIFSIALQKFSRYILPVYPAVALLLGSFWDELMEKPPLREWSKNRPLLAYGLAVLLGLTVAHIFSKFHAHQFEPSSLMIAVITVAFVCLAGTLRYVIRARQLTVLFIFIFLLTSTFEAAYGRAQFLWDNKTRSEKTLCLKISSLIEPGTPWAVYNTFRPAHIYYTKSHPKIIFSQDELVSFMGGKEMVYCLIHEEDYEELTSKTNMSLYLVEKLHGPKKSMKDLMLITNKPKEGSTSP